MTSLSIVSQARDQTDCARLQRGATIILATRALRKGCVRNKVGSRNPEWDGGAGKTRRGMTRRRMRG
eukprot:9471084-Pyramimonas_sp.AAC.1